MYSFLDNFKPEISNKTIIYNKESHNARSLSTSNLLLDVAIQITHITSSFSLIGTIRIAPIRSTRRRSRGTDSCTRFSRN